jgi:dihydroorotate dehydrogenase (NAD+) catalytic subunit
MPISDYPTYDGRRTYDWNYDHPPDPVQVAVPAMAGTWQFCGLPVDSPLGVPAGPLLNARWCLYYASLGFDVLTYKTVRSCQRDCYPLPNLQPVRCGMLQGGESNLSACDEMNGSWAVSYGMPSKGPDQWRHDVQWARDALPRNKLLSVSVVGTTQEHWTLDDLADDYARCARWAVESGADCVEMNFSCPNVATCDGQLYQHPDDAERVAQRVRSRIGATPLIAKIGRVVAEDELRRLLHGLAEVVDAAAMTNSIAATVQNAAGQLLFDGQRRGICGAATLDASVRQTRMAAEIIQQDALELQLIGVGGAASIVDLRRYLEAGAHAVQIATAAMVNPGLALKIRRDFGD